MLKANPPPCTRYKIRNLCRKKVNNRAINALHMYILLHLALEVAI